MAKKKKTITPEQPKLFEKFWQKYAMKVDRIAAVRAWNKLDKDLRREAIDGIQHYRDVCDSLGAKRMWPQGYLNHTRWRDEYTPPAPGNQRGGCTEYKDLKSATSRIANAHTHSDGILCKQSDQGRAANPPERDEREADLPDMAIW